MCGAQGTLYDSFTSDKVRWNEYETLADVASTMEIQDGSINGIPVSGTGTFNGVLDYRPLEGGLPPAISGTLQLQVSAASTTGGALPGTGGPPLALLIGSCLFGLYILRRSP